MKTYEDFKQDYISYMTENKKKVTDDMIKKAYQEYKKNTGEETKPEKTIKKAKTALDRLISENLKEIKDLRERKKAGEDVKERLREVTKELHTNREEKKRRKNENK